MSPKGKDLTSNKHKNFVVYTFECCCSNSYISQTSRDLETRIKEPIPKYVKDQVSNQPNTIIVATLNAMNRSSTSAHLIKNLICGKNYKEMKVKILRSCNNTFVLIEIKVI